MCLEGLTLRTVQSTGDRSVVSFGPACNYIRLERCEIGGFCGLILPLTKQARAPAPPRPGGRGRGGRATGPTAQPWPRGSLCKALGCLPAAAVAVRVAAAVCALLGIAAGVPRCCSAPSSDLGGPRPARVAGRRP